MADTAQAMNPRPKTVLIVAGFLFAAAGMAAVVGTSLLFPNRVMDRLWELNPSAAPAFHALGKVSGLLLLALGLATFTAAQGLLRRKRWAWWFALVLFAVNGCGQAAAFFLTGEALRSLSGMILTAIFLYLLARPRVTRYFHGS